MAVGESVSALISQWYIIGAGRDNEWAVMRLSVESSARPKFERTAKLGGNKLD